MFGSGTAGMGEISKQRQLNEKIWSGAVQDEMDFEILMCASFNEQG